MTYQISRDGQTYGPYTIEDLRRYIASGNILPTDLAKGEDMASWLPVSQILSSTEIETPYVPPASYTAPAADESVSPVNYQAPTPAASYATPYAQYPDPPNLNWGLELLLGLLTCGFFVVIWNLVIAAWAKRVEPTSKAFYFYIAATVLLVLNLGASWSVFIAIAQHQQQHQSALGSIISVATWVVRLIARFSLHATLEQHYNGPEPIGLRMNPVLTFFFGGLYFQYKLNRVHEMKQALRYQNPAR